MVEKRNDRQENCEYRAGKCRKGVYHRRLTLLKTGGVGAGQSGASQSFDANKIGDETKFNRRHS